MVCEVVCLFIECVKNNGAEYLRLSESYRPIGSKRPTRRVVCNLGFLNKLSDGQPDYLNRLRESYKKGTPILPALEPYVQKSSGNEPEYVMLPFPISGDDPNGCFTTKRYADLLLNAYMEELGVAQLFRQIKSSRRIQFDLLGFVKLIVYGRILEPASKCATVKQNDSYYTPILDEGFNPYKVYDTLDVVYENQKTIFQTVDKALRKRINGRDTSIVFYDVTNFYFEIERADEDVLDNDGVIIEEGIRKLGHCKEGRPQPIVQMGLFMDKDGVPIGTKVFPGNRVDKATMISATSEIITPLEYGRYIYCADRGLCTMANLAFLVQQKMGYLLSKSIKQSKKEDREWIVDPTGYVEEKNENGEVTFKYKSRITTREYKDNQENVTVFKEKVVAFWSLEYYKREQHMMEKFSQFLTQLETSTKSFTLTNSQVKNIKRFLKAEVLEELEPENDESPENQSDGTNVNVVADTDTVSDSHNASSQDTSSSTEDSGNIDDSGIKPKKRVRLTQEEKDKRKAEKKAEAARLKSLKDSRNKRLMEQLKDSNEARIMIDWEKVHRWRDFAGYYQIVTSELEMPDLEIIRTYRGLTQIENRFRTMKGTLYARPINVQTAEHIEAHLVLVTLALILLTLIQSKLKDHEKQAIPEDQKWSLGMDSDRIQDALNALEVEPLPQQYFRFRSRTDSQAGQDLQRILDAHGIELQSRLYKPGELRSLRGSIHVL